MKSHSIDSKRYKKAIEEEEVLSFDAFPFLDKDCYKKPSTEKRNSRYIGLLVKNEEAERMEKKVLIPSESAGVHLHQSRVCPSSPYTSNYKQYVSATVVSMSTAEPQSAGSKLTSNKKHRTKKYSIELEEIVYLEEEGEDEQSPEELIEMYRCKIIARNSTHYKCHGPNLDSPCLKDEEILHQNRGELEKVGSSSDDGSVSIQEFCLDDSKRLIYNHHEIKSDTRSSNSILTLRKKKDCFLLDIVEDDPDLQEYLMICRLAME